MGFKVRNNVNEYAEYPHKLINSEDIEKMGYKWFSRNTIPNKIKQGNYLLNLDSSEGAGTHWTLITISYPFLFYYDPFGNNLMSGYSPTEVDNLANRMNLTQIENPYWQQHVKSWACGYNCLFTAKSLDPYIGKLTIPLYKKILFNNFGDSPDGGDISKWTKWAKQNNLL